MRDNFLYMKGLRESYKVGEVKFRVGCEKIYSKTFLHQFKPCGSFMPETVHIQVDVTDEFIVPFEDNQMLVIQSIRLIVNQVFIQY